MAARPKKKSPRGLSGEKQDTPPKQPRAARLFWLAAILVVTFVAYLPSLDNGFTNWDDDKYVLFEIDSQGEVCVLPLGDAEDSTDGPCGDEQDITEGDFIRLVVVARDGKAAPDRSRRGRRGECSASCAWGPGRTVPVL